MGKTRFNTARDFLKELKENNGEVVPFDLLRQEIIKKIGSHERRTTKPYVKLMLEFNMITQEENNNVRINEIP